MQCLLLGACHSTESAQQMPSEGSTKQYHHSYFVDRETYDTYYQALTDAILPFKETVLGGIVPHHLYVGPEFARFYSALRNQHPSVVVVIGPNHFDAGQGKILSTDESYETPFGILQTNTALLSELVKHSACAIERQPFDREHSISSEVAFIKKELPDTTLLPLILKQKVTQQEAQDLAKTLNEILPKDAIVLASVDFSHYLPELVADFHDQTSETAIKNFDINAVQNLEIDSPASITTLLTYLKMREEKRILYERHTNSASYGKHPELQETTSHFFIAFGKGEEKTEKAASVLFFGDTIFDRGVVSHSHNQNDSSIFSDIAGKEDRFFRGNTINAVNLEGPVVTYGKNPEKSDKILFQFDPNFAIPLLRKAKINITSIANNHIEDQGKQGLIETERYLTDFGIESVGGTYPCINKLALNGSAAICSFFDGGGLLDVTNAMAFIQQAKQQANHVVVSVHWGREYTSQITDRQHALADAFIKAGADAVIGHGPHIIQEMDIEHGVPVFYSIGNFLFDEEDEKRSSGLAVGLFFSPGKTTVYVFPLHTVASNPRLYSYIDSLSFFKDFLRGKKIGTSELPGKIIINRP
jgi:AmmeMemoRadiSam system protein B